MFINTEDFLGVAPRGWGCEAVDVERENLASAGGWGGIRRAHGFVFEFGGGALGARAINGGIDFVVGRCEGGAKDASIVKGEA